MAMLAPSAIYGGWGHPDFGFCNTVPTKVRRIAHSHYLLLVAIAAAIYRKDGNGDDLVRFAHGFRLGYAWNDGVLAVLRFSPAGTDGMDWYCEDHFCRAANLLESELSRNDDLQKLATYNHKLLFQVSGLDRATTTRSVRICRSFESFFSENCANNAFNAVLEVAPRVANGEWTTASATGDDTSAKDATDLVEALVKVLSQPKEVVCDMLAKLKQDDKLALRKTPAVAQVIESLRATRPSVKADKE